MNKQDIQAIIERHPQFQAKLFCRGFLLTDTNIDSNIYPFYGIWKRETLYGYTLLVSPKQHYSVYKQEESCLILIGHTYNPIDGLIDEQLILKNIGSAEDSSDYLNQLTGVFTFIRLSNEGKKIEVFGDATCMQSTFFGTSNKHTYVSSHTNLIGDVANLEWDIYVKRLTKYKFFGLLGNSLPGDLTQFKEIKRLTPNFCAIYENAKWRMHRFYTPRKLILTNEEIADKVGILLHANMELIATKWKKPAISCTGGCDSKTTLACTSGLYHKFKYFSYISNPSEKVDALAAKTIVSALGEQHTTYIIPSDDAEVSLVDEARAIIDWSTGNITPNNRNDIRKRRFFEDTKDFDIEVKSWASEVGRAYYSKRFNGRKDFGRRPTARKCTAMYKFFLHNRKLVRQTDKVFADFLNTYFHQDSTRPIDWQEQLFWEFRCPSWNGLVITGEHRYSFDITIPYNNRMILELLLSAPIEDRINDTIYSMIRERMNPLIDKTGIAVTNVLHTSNRAKAEDLYYWLSTHLPF